jgi:hypothetical protein
MSFLARAMDMKDRVTKAVAEVSGLAGPAVEPPVPELAQHGKQDEQLRALYKCADNYIQRMNAMCEASSKLAEVFDEAVAAHPSLKAVSAEFLAVQGAVNKEHLALLGQMMHRKLFKPIRAEIEARKPLDAKIAEHKKYKADYDAYKRRMTEHLQAEPGRREQTLAEMQSAEAQYLGRTKQVVVEASEAMEARNRILAKGLIALVSIQQLFFHGTEESLAAAVDRCRSSADFRGVSIASLFDQAVDDCKAVKQHIAQGRVAPDAAPPQFAQPPPQQQPAAQPQRPPGVAAQSSGSSLLDGGGAGRGGGGGMPPLPQMSAQATVAVGEMDLLGGFGSPPPAQQQSDPTNLFSQMGFGEPAATSPQPAGLIPSFSNATGGSSDDMFGAFGGSSQVAAQPSMEADLLGGMGGGMGGGGMGEMGGGGMGGGGMDMLGGGMGGGMGDMMGSSIGGGGFDDMMMGFGSSAPAPPAAAVGMNSDPFAGAFGAPMAPLQPSAAALPAARPAAAASSGGGAAKVQSAGHASMMASADPTNGLSREQLAAQREKATADAMAATVRRPRVRSQPARSQPARCSTAVGIRGKAMARVAHPLVPPRVH